MGNRHTLEKAGAVAFALLLWQIAAMALDQHLLLVSPVQVLFRFGTLCLEPGFLQTIAFSLLRIAGGFFLAFLLGTGLGILAGRCRYVELFLWPFMLTIKSVPVASYVILCLIWLSSAQLPVFISFLTMCYRALKPPIPSFWKWPASMACPLAAGLYSSICPRSSPFCSPPAGLPWVWPGKLGSPQR